MCWRAFKCGELGRGRRCGVLPILHARQGAGRGHGVLTMRGGAGSGGRRERALESHVFWTNLRGFPTGEIGSQAWAILIPCRGALRSSLRERTTFGTCEGNEGKRIHHGEQA